MLQDLRSAVATPEFEMRLAEMRRVGEAPGKSWEKAGAAFEAGHGFSLLDGNGALSE